MTHEYWHPPRASARVHLVRPGDTVSLCGRSIESPWSIDWVRITGEEAALSDRGLCAVCRGAVEAEERDR